METSELLKKVRKIEIKSKGLSRQIFAGEYNSAFKGRGMSFSEVREYIPGDDVKSIDWNVTARLNAPYIKVFQEEREMTVMLLVDVSGSSFFGTQGQMKHERITEICAVLAFSAIQNNDKVGVLFFSDQVEKFIPPKKGKSHVLLIIRTLLDFAYGKHAEERAEQWAALDKERGAWDSMKELFGFGMGKKSPAEQPPKTMNKAEGEGGKEGLSEAGGEEKGRFAKKRDAEAEKGGQDSSPHTNISAALRYFSNVLKRPCTAFLFSDFVDTEYSAALQLAAKRHDLIGLHIYDPAEEELPNWGMIKALDPETGQCVWLDTNDKRTRQRHADFFAENAERCKTNFARSGADLIKISTAVDYVQPLMRFFKGRG